LEPEQMRGLLVEAGFAIVAVYGDYDRRPLTADSSDQVWVARRP
jgi:hypothetical protein